MKPLKDCHATLYTFAGPGLGVGQIKVVRITNSTPDDWHKWPESYSAATSTLGPLLEIARIEIVDDRDNAEPLMAPATA
jgi:hypothetical protein